MGDDFKLRAAEEMKKEIEERLNKHYSTNDKEAVEKFIKGKHEKSDNEAKKLEAETKKAINDLKNIIPRAGRNTKIEVTDDLPPGVTDEEYRILEEYIESTAGNETKKAVFHIEELEKLVKNNVDVHLRVGERALRIARDLLQLSLKNSRTELTEEEANLVEKSYDK